MNMKFGSICVFLSTFNNKKLLSFIFLGGISFFLYFLRIVLYSDSKYDEIHKISNNFPVFKFSFSKPKNYKV